MKTFLKISLRALAMCMTAGLASAQTHSIDWYKVAGGGGTSTGAVYSVTGTIGQPDASGAMSGGNYSILSKLQDHLNQAMAEKEMLLQTSGDARSARPGTGRSPDPTGKRSGEKFHQINEQTKENPVHPTSVILAW